MFIVNTNELLIFRLSDFVKRQTGNQGFAKKRPISLLIELEKV